MSRCVTDQCTQGREPCPTPMTCAGIPITLEDGEGRLYRVTPPFPIEFAEPEPVDFTQRETFGWIVDVALTLTLAVAAAGFAVWATVENWPLFLAAVK